MQSLNSPAKTPEDIVQYTVHVTFFTDSSPQTPHLIDFSSYIVDYFLSFAQAVILIASESMSTESGEPCEGAVMLETI